MSENINTLIDLGSNNLKCATFSYEGKKSNLIAFSEKKTRGIHNSIITNFDEACKSLSSVISDVEKKSKITLEKITVIIEPKELVTTRITNFKKMEGNKIDKSDINFLLRESKKNVEKNDKNFSQIHIFNNIYKVDEKIYKELPINIFCNKLSVENIFVSLPLNILKNINAVFNYCNLEINKFISSSYASGIYLFDKQNLQEGCVIIDIGFEKTSVAIFQNYSLIKLSVFPIGSNHISKDISKVCYLNQEEAEKIKLDYLLSNKLDKNNSNIDYLPEEYFIFSKYRKIPLNFIHDIISSRVEEIMQQIIKQMNIIDLKNINQRLFFIGGGSGIVKNIEKINSGFDNSLFKNFDIIDNNEINLNSINCISGQNLFLNGWPSEAVGIPMQDQKKGIFTRFFELFN